jgi:dTDP-glucose 4,6-dehydratase
MDTKVLVTGGAGFIGSTLTRRLLDQKYKVTVFDDLSTGLSENLPRSNRLKLIQGDVRDFKLVSKAVGNHQYVMHLAAHAFIPFSYQMPVEVAEVNALGSINVLKACNDKRVKRLVHISSSEVYGPAQYTPMDEKHPFQPYSTYSVAKAAADLWAQAFYWEHKLPVVILRPFNTFGPRESLPYFIPEVIRQCSKERVIQVGNLESSRDFTYVEDTADALVKALEIENIEGEIINIGTGQTHKIWKILELIKREMRTKDKEVVSTAERLRPRDVGMLVSSTAKARKTLGWKPSVTFEQGIRKTIQWYAENAQTWGYEKHHWKWRY